jgi:hypothetical protein
MNLTWIPRHFMSKLTAHLFRGDGDYAGTRNLKNLLKRGFVQTNLVNGGSGREIFERPIIQSIKNHVTDDWRSTHFLSFSENEQTAINFGLGRSNQNREFDEYWDEDDDWDFLILSITGHNFIDVEEKSPGIYSARFIPSFKQFLPTYDILLINVVKVLSSVPADDSKHREALFNAKRDSEWLLLPTQPTDFSGRTEFRGLLDAILFSDILRCRFV